jgi:hypothetical protein
MPRTGERRTQYWLVHGLGWPLLLYLIVAQAVAAFSYDLGVSMGTQESPAVITEVGAAFWYGFAFGDLFVYVPLLLAGLIGHWMDTGWGRTALVAALGITVYWPIVCLAALVDARDAAGWNLASEGPYWVVCILIAAWGALSLASILRSPPGGSE